jgi:predicted Rossmann fold flavoprotein
MAAVTAAERGVRAVLIERKHRPGRKILLCGNNRCNLSSAMTVDRMVEAFGEPVGEFLRPAISNFPPDKLMSWFKRNGLSVSVHKDGRIFPSSEKADDVLHVFSDLLRDSDVPVVYNSPVEGVKVIDGGFLVETGAMEIECENLLIATGGVSYPKTGSVGDGQKFARALGHKVVPYRPGLVGFVMKDLWLHNYKGASFMGTEVRIVFRGKEIAVTYGEILCNSWGLSGPALVNASRVIARQNLSEYELIVDLKPELSHDELVQLLVARIQKRGGRCKLADVLANAFVPKAMCKDFISKMLGLEQGIMMEATPGPELKKIAEKMKAWKVPVKGTRPLKEAMVTVGGVALGDIDSTTMGSKRCDGLFFTGEVLDVDGPTGGFNLQAAFATARLAVDSICGPDTRPPVKKPRAKRPGPGGNRGQRRRRR